MSAAKGRRGEREFISLLTEHGFTLATIPGSDGTEHAFDDILAGDGDGLLFAAEVKRWGSGRSYLKQAQADAVCEFAHGLHPDCHALVAVRWDYDTTWYVNEIDALERTPTGNIAIAKAVCQGEWPAFDSWVAAADSG